MQSYVDLKRRFLLRESYSPEELMKYEISAKALTWTQIERSKVAVIVAPANFGKTTELTEQVRKMRRNGKLAVFVALRKILEFSSFEDGLGHEEAKTFRKWISDTSQELTLFIDSLDEAALGMGYRLEKGLKLVTDAVGWPSSVVRLTISSRPAVLDQDARSLLEDTLAMPIRSVEVIEGVSNSGKRTKLESAGHVKQGVETASETIDIFSMLPLTRRQAMCYLEGPCKVSGSLPLLQAAKQHGLGSLCEHPGGLAVLTNIDFLRHPPECLTEVFKKVLEGHPSQGEAQRIADAGHPPVEARRETIYKLAAASLLCQRPHIELSLDVVVKNGEALSAAVIAGDLLDAPALKYVLGSSQFIDVGQPEVKLFPDELVPYWAAKRLSRLVSSTELAVRLLDCITWKSPMGEQGVYRELLPLAGWLATLSAQCRAQLLSRDPQAVAFFGDMRAPGFPLADAERALRDTFQKVAENGDRLGRGYFVLTSENYWQAGGPSFRNVLRELFVKWGSHSEVREQLLCIGFCSKVDYFRDLVLQESKQNYANVLAKQADVEYLSELGLTDDLAGLARALTMAISPDERTVSALLPKLAWHHLTTDELTRLVVAQIAGASGGFRVSYALANRVAFDAPESKLYEFVEQLFLAAEQWGSTYSEYIEPLERLADLIASQFTILIEQTSCMYLEKTAALYLRVEQFFIDKLAASVDCTSLQAALAENTMVRRAIINRVLAEKKYSAEDLCFRFFGYGRFCPLILEDASTLGNPLLKEAIRLQEDAVTAQAATDAAIRDSQRKKGEIILSAKSISTWSEGIEDIRSGNNLPLMSEISNWLMDTGVQTKPSKVDFKLLEHYCGKDFLEAVKAGFGAVWRMTPAPLTTLIQDDPLHRLKRVQIGLHGLELELGDGGGRPEMTTLEVKLAIQHGVLEFNRVPEWFHCLLGHYPDVALAELSSIVDAADEGLASSRVAEFVLRNLQGAPRCVQQGVAPHGLRFIIKHPLSLMGVLVGVLELFGPEDSALITNEFVTTAQKTVEEWPMLFETGSPAESAISSEQIKSRMTWAAYWFTLAPSTFVAWFESCTLANNRSKEDFLFEFAVFVKRRDFNFQKLLAREDASGVRALSWLHTRLLELVKPVDDKPRDSGVIYTPSNRDYAEKFRDSLISLIGAAKSHFAYQELLDLSRTASGEYLSYIQSMMFQLQERRNARAPLLQRDYQRFEDNLTPPVSDWMSFAFSVHNDLNLVKYSIEEGEFSLRRFFSSVAFEKAKSKKVGLALEEDFQAFLGNELNHFAANRYTVALEPQLPEATRRDILCRKGSYRASIELKMSERWTLADYIESLEKQLVGQYMRARDSKAGFFIVVLQRDRKWKVSPTEDIRFPELIARLEEKALSLEAAHPGSFIRIVGINAVPPNDFRAERAASSQKPYSKSGATPA